MLDFKCKKNREIGYLGMFKDIFFISEQQITEIIAKDIEKFITFRDALRDSSKNSVNYRLGWCDLPITEILSHFLAKNDEKFREIEKTCLIDIHHFRHHMRDSFFHFEPYVRQQIGCLFFAKFLETPRPTLEYLIKNGHTNGEARGFQNQGIGGPTTDRILHLALGFYKRNQIKIGKLLDDEEKMFLAGAHEVNERKTNPEKY